MNLAHVVVLEGKEVLLKVCLVTFCNFLFLQGSYHCGQCKPGYTGDQVRGCQAERSCRNRALNPCSVHARCIEEKRGEVTCIVSS